MISKVEELKRVHGELLSGVVKLKSFDKIAKSNGNGKFGAGEVFLKGGEIVQFKIWSESVMSQLDNLAEEYGSKSFFIDVVAEGNEYRNQYNLIITGVTAIQQNIDVSEYMVVKHDLNSLVSRINNVLNDSVSKKGATLFNKIIEPHLDRFSIEFAGSKMHDAEPRGLMFHTTKMLEIAHLVMKQHDNFNQSQDYIDLIYVGVLIHDLGKILELNDGVYTDISIASHRGLGVEILVEHKRTIVDLYSEDIYYNFMAIILQHHGQYEERPRTIFSYLIHLVDNFDTSVTILHEYINKSENGQNIRMNDFNLKVYKD